MPTITEATKPSARTITDHYKIHLIYFFEANRLRVELTTWTVDAEVMARAEREAADKFSFLPTV